MEDKKQMTCPDCGEQECKRFGHKFYKVHKFCLSFNGTRAKIKHFLSLKWIKIHNRNDVVYKFVKDEECPEIREW